MMNTKQIKVFEELLANPEFKGKDQLKHLLWLNTSDPKYKKGECFKVTDRSRRIYGFPIVNFNAKIVRIFSWKDEEEHYYELEIECDFNGKGYTTKIARSESELKERCEDNKNFLGEAKSERCDSISVSM